jgi:hypothetical protein
MDTNVTVAIVTGSCTALVGIAAIVTNTFWIGRTLSSIERRLELIETDLKQFYKDITQIRIKLNMD